MTRMEAMKKAVRAAKEAVEGMLPLVVRNRIDNEGMPDIELCHHCDARFMPYDLFGRDHVCCPTCHRADWKNSPALDVTISYDKTCVEENFESQAR